MMPSQEANDGWNLALNMVIDRSNTWELECMLSPETIISLFISESMVVLWRTGCRLHTSTRSSPHPSIVSRLLFLWIFYLYTIFISQLSHCIYFCSRMSTTLHIFSHTWVISLFSHTYQIAYFISNKYHIFLFSHTYQIAYFISCKYHIFLFSHIHIKLHILSHTNITLNIFSHTSIML